MHSCSVYNDTATFEQHYEASERNHFHLQTKNKINAVFSKWINVVQYQSNDDV